MPVTTPHPAPLWTGRDDPEDGDYALRMHHIVQQQAARGLIGFASDAGVRRNKGRPGAHEGPTALRKALANMAAPVSLDGLCDLGDVEVTGDKLELGQTELARRIAGAPVDIERLVVLGGGHETAFASYSGLVRKHPDKRIGIINLDAHLDLRLVGERGPSSGTPFAQIRNLDPEKFDYLCLGLAEESNTTALIDRASDWGVGMITDHALIADGKSADRAIDEIVARSDLIYLTIDIDVLPHYVAPGVSAPAARGVPFATIEYLVGKVLSQCKEAECPCPVADIVELSPPHDSQGVTAKSAALLARQLLSG